MKTTFASFPEILSSWTPHEDSFCQLSRNPVLMNISSRQLPLFFQEFCPHKHSATLAPDKTNLPLRHMVLCPTKHVLNFDYFTFICSYCTREMTDHLVDTRLNNDRFCLRDSFKNWRKQKGNPI